MTDVDDKSASGSGPTRSKSRWGSRHSSEPPAPDDRGPTMTPSERQANSSLTEVRVITQQAVIDETSIRPLRAVVVHMKLAAWVFGAIFLAGIAYGVTAPTQHEAEVDLFVGRLDASVEAIPALVAANEELAQNYSRLLSTPELVASVGERTGLTDQEVRDRTSSTQLAGSPFIRVTGAGSTPEEAEELTAVAAQLLTVLANEFATVADDPDELLAEHQAQVAALNQARADVAREQQTIETTESDTLRDAAITRLYEAQAEVDVLTFRISVLETQFLDTERATASEGLVRQVSEVEGIGSNRLGNLSLGLAIGLLGGIVIAVSLVTLLEIVRAVQSEPETAVDET